MIMLADACRPCRLAKAILRAFGVLLMIMLAFGDPAVAAVATIWSNFGQTNAFSFAFSSRETLLLILKIAVHVRQLNERQTSRIVQGDFSKLDGARRIKQQVQRPLSNRKSLLVRSPKYIELIFRRIFLVSKQESSSSKEAFQEFLGQKLFPVEGLINLALNLIY